MENFVGALGRKTIRSANRLMDLCALTYRLTAIAFPLPRTGRALIKRVIVEQVHFTAVQALPVIIPVALITGSMLIVQFSQLSGQVDLGRLLVLLVLREMGPLVTAIIVILRSATAVTIEMSYMCVLHEIDALEMAGIDPLHTVCFPRLVGITTAIVSLILVFDLMAIIGITHPSRLSCRVGQPDAHRLGIYLHCPRCSEYPENSYRRHDPIH